MINFTAHKFTNNHHFGGTDSSSLKPQPTMAFFFFIWEGPVTSTLQTTRNIMVTSRLINRWEHLTYQIVRLSSQSTLIREARWIIEHCLLDPGNPPPQTIHCHKMFAIADNVGMSCICKPISGCIARSSFGLAAAVGIASWRLVQFQRSKQLST